MNARIMMSIIVVIGLASCIENRDSSRGVCIRRHIDRDLREFINITTLSLPIFDEQIEEYGCGETVFDVLSRTRFSKDIGYIIQTEDMIISESDEVASVRDLFNIIAENREVIILLGANGCIVKNVMEDDIERWVREPELGR